MLPVESRRHARRSLLRSAIIVVALCAFFVFLPLRGDRWWLGALLGFIGIVGTVPLTVKRVHAVRMSEEPVVTAIEALILLVTLLVLGFSSVYYAMDAHQAEFAGMETRLDAVYFTITTMATVGYGDIHPAGQAARAVASVQMIMNLAFVGVVVRVLARAARGAMATEDDY